MKKQLLCLMAAVIMAGSGAAMTACGSSSGEEEQEQATQATQETVQAADPMTDEEMENDDTDGCIEDSQDLLY